jgi:hypothetical protein
MRYQPERQRGSSGDAVSTSDMGVTALLWFVFLDVLVTVIMNAYFALGAPSSGLRDGILFYTLMIAFFGAAALCLWGTIWLLCMAFREDASQGILCLLVPFYALYYSMNRWQERRGPFGLTLAPVAWILVTLGIGAATAFLQGMARGIERASQQADASPDSGGNPDMPAVPGNTAGPNPPGFWPGSGRTALKADADVVRRAEAIVRQGIDLLKQKANVLATIHDGFSAQHASHSLQFTSMFGHMRFGPQRDVVVGPNEMVALKHRVGQEIIQAVTNLKNQLMRIQSIPGVRVVLEPGTMSGLDKLIADWTIKPGEETMPELVEPPARANRGGLRGMPGPFSPPVIDLRGFDERLQGDYESVRQQYGDRTVAILVSGLESRGGIPFADLTQALSQRIKELAPEIQQSRGFRVGNQWATVVAPVNDAQALAIRIDFGTVTVKGSRIEVQLDPRWVAKVPLQAIAAGDPQPRPRRPESDPEVPPGADAITRSLIQLKSSDMGKKKEAIERLERSTPDGRVDQVVQALIPLLDHDDGFLVTSVEKTLAVWRSPEAVTPLIARTRDNRHFVRSEAIKALGKYQELRAAEAIVAVMKEDGFAAESALKEMGTVAEPAVIPLLRSGDSDLRGKACDILGQIGGQETLQTMQVLPADPNFGVRAAAQRAWKAIVARVGPPPKPARGDRAGTGKVPRN